MIDKSIIARDTKLTQLPKVCQYFVSRFRVDGIDPNPQPESLYKPCNAALTPMH